MSLIIDTSVLIEIEKGKKEIIDELIKLKEFYPAKPKISFISYFEFVYGLRNKSVKNKEKAVAFLNDFEIIHTTDLMVKHLITLKENYELPLADLIICSQVLEKGDTLFTKDKDFENIKEINRIIWKGI
jgi:predicted nucleic acid-binding protein